MHLEFESDLVSGIRSGGTFQQWGNGAWKNQADAVANFSQNWAHSGNVFSKEFEFSTYPTSGAGQIYVLFDLKSGSPNVAGFTLTDVDLLASCSAAPAEEDTEAPVMTSASLVSNTHNSAVIAVVATDNVGVTKYVVYNNAAKQGEYAPSDGKITVTGLTPNTAYTLTIKAKDAAGNESAEGKNVTFTTNGDPKADNTQCSGWNDDIWASEGGYTYDFSTNNNEVTIKITALGAEPKCNAGFLFLPDAGDKIINGIKSGKVMTLVLNGDNLAAVKRSDGTIKVRTRFEKDGGGLYESGYYTYTVGEDCQPHPVESVSITSTFTEIEVGQSMTMTAAVTPANATNKNVTWSITEGSGASINASTGLLTANAVGSVTVQVETVDGNKTDTKTITIVAAKPSAPSSAPDAPTHPANKVKAIYSPTYNATACNHDAWGGSTSFEKQDEGIKIVLNSGNGFVGFIDFGTLNCSDMESFHADVWVKNDASMRFVPIITGQAEQGVTKQLTGGQWNSIDIALNEGDWAQTTDWTQVFQLKIDNAAGLTFWINNIYFYTTSEETKYAVSAIAGDGGSATASASSVTSGTEVTFTATPDCGYQFASWTKGGEVIVSAGATYTTAITEETTLTANFTTTFATVTPTHETTNVMTVYGEYGKQTGLNVAPGWGQVTAYNETTIGGKKMARYTNINYQGLDFDANRMDVSNMQYVHIDLYASVESDIKFSLIWAAAEIAVTKHLEGCTMESLDIPLSEFTGADLTTIRQLKFDAQGLSLAGKTLIVQNIYFYKLPPAPVTGVSLDKTEATLKIGKTLTLTATVAPANAGNKNVTWSSDREGVAIVENGVVTAVAEGTANITVTTEDGNYTATCAVTVNAGNPDEVELTSGDHTIVYTAYLIAEKTYQVTITSDEHIIQHGGSYWYVDGVSTPFMKNENFSQPDGNTIIITVTINGTTAPQLHTPLYINMPGEVNFGNVTFNWIDKRPVVDVESVTINNAPETMAINEQVALTATVAPAEVINKSVTWSIINGSTLAEIDANGILTAKAAGEITVQATSVADDTKSDSKTITITSQEAEPKVFYGCASKDEIDILYSITFNTDRTITYTAQINHNKTGLNPQVNIKGDGVYSTLAPQDGKYQYTTSDKFLAGTEMNSGFFYMAYQGTPGNTRIDFTYTVGAENVLISDKWDNTERISATATKTTDALLGRTFIADGYNYTLCLPFDMTADQCLAAFGANYTLWEMGAAYMKTTDVMYLPFDKVTSIEAGKPYFFCPAADVVNPTIEGVTIDAADPASIGNALAMMTGIYSPSVVAASNYVLGPDNWLYQSDGTQMYGLRCYFTFGSAAPANVRARAIFHDTDVVTDLETIEDAQHAMPNGKYIIDGQFVIIRNGKQYNAVGQAR